VAVSILAMSVQSKKTRGARKPTGGSCAIAMTSVVQARARGKRAGQDAGQRPALATRRPSQFVA
jgi:hypothetical protein